MNDLWGISGPDFLELYGALLVLPALIGVYLHWRTTRRNPVDASDLSVHHLAYLCGQARRATESAVAALVEAERVRVSSKGLLSRIGTANPADPVERAAFHRCSGVRVPNLVPLMGDATGKLADDLAARGLVLPVKALAKDKRTVAWLYAAVGVFGLVRLFAGLSVHHPVGYLVLLLVVDAVAIAVAVGLARRARSDVLTEAGQDLVRQARRDKDRRGAAAEVAVKGLRSYPDRDLAAALTYSPPPTKRPVRRTSVRSGGTTYLVAGSSCGTASCSTSSCSSSASSCSSSSCGGGGSSCGGGGGCGG